MGPRASWVGSQTSFALTSAVALGPDCGICPVLKEDLALFLGPSLPDYVDFVSQYRNESAVLKNAENLKICADNKLTEEDKANVKSLLKEVRRRGRKDTGCSAQSSQTRPPGSLPPQYHLASIGFLDQPPESINISAWHLFSSPDLLS
ncbi:hypothetical protein U0070_014006 [Myodes glareolus]|uniref:Uncharacterized protein n=1 Tax=Myodes glareolus TaxID=447135 RepID=A0AAW0H2T6_MYOGA